MHDRIMMIPQDASYRFETYVDYQQAFLDVVSRAQHGLTILERDLSEAGLGSQDACNVLWELFTRQPAGRMQVLVEDAEYLGRHCARFMQLRSYFSHRIEVRCIDNIEGWKQGFVIADGQICLIRPHFDWPRGEVSGDAMLVARMQQKFNEVWHKGCTPAEWHSLNL